MILNYLIDIIHNYFNNILTSDLLISRSSGCDRLKMMRIRYKVIDKEVEQKHKIR